MLLIMTIFTFWNGNIRQFCYDSLCLCVFSMINTNARFCWLLVAKRFSNPYFITLIVLLYKLDPNKFEIKSYVRLSIVTIMTATIHSSSNWITKTSTKANQCKHLYIITLHLYTLDDSHRTGTTEIVQQLKVVPHYSEAYLLTVFFINTLFGPIFSFLCCLQCSLTLLIACAISVVPVRWLSSSVQI